MSVAIEFDDGRCRRHQPKCVFEHLRDLSQSTVVSSGVSWYTPNQSEKVPLADVGGLKERTGSLRTSASRTPGGAGHHSETKSSLWWSWK
jgi:hypothetical protein